MFQKLIFQQYFRPNEETRVKLTEYVMRDFYIGPIRRELHGKWRRYRRTVAYELDILPEHRREVLEYLGSSIA